MWSWSLKGVSIPSCHRASQKHAVKSGARGPHLLWSPVSERSRSIDLHFFFAGQALDCWIILNYFELLYWQYIFKKTLLPLIWDLIWKVLSSSLEVLAIHLGVPRLSEWIGRQVSHVPKGHSTESREGKFRECLPQMMGWFQSLPEGFEKGMVFFAGFRSFFCCFFFKIVMINFVFLPFYLSYSDLHPCSG